MPIALSLVLHNHQPVGNFGWVIEDVHERAYAPMIDALERHPGVRVGLHYTGPLLAWLESERPEALERIAALIARGQVEILGGGLEEPVLVALPERDRHAQLTRMAAEVERLFGVRPRGAWLAERVWEPSLPADLARGGYQWTILDDNHLRAAAVPEDEMWGAFTTDDQGERLTVFGTEQGLRYRIPFRPVHEVIDYLRAQEMARVRRRLGVMGDDGEKFGSWPDTYDWCWGSGRWVDDCFAALDASGSWLETVTPSAWLDRAGVAEAPRRIYVPTSSYVEMTQWALPARESTLFHDLLEEAREADLPEARFLRGGFWRGFQARYREINDLHKQMLRASAKVAAMPEGAARALAVEHLHRGQSNDVYWHGLFGGIYLVHLRTAALAELIAAEDLADGAGVAAGTAFGAASGVRLADVDLDGLEEVYLATEGQVLTVDLPEGAGIGSWDLRATRLPLLSVMARRPEAYHEGLLSASAGEDDARAGGPRTIHDPVAVADPALVAALRYDVRERRSALVELLPAGTGPFPAEALAAGEVPALADLTAVPWRLESLADDMVIAAVEANVHGSPLRVERHLTFGGGRLDPWLEVEIAVSAGALIAATLALEWNVDLMGGGGNPQAWYETPAGLRSPHDGRGTVESVEWLRFGNDYVGARVELTPLGVAPSASWAPIETVSRSESGYELTYQGSALVLLWPIRVEPAAPARVGVRLAVAQDRDVAIADRPA